MMHRRVSGWLAAALLTACTGVSVQKHEDPRLPQLRAKGLRIAVLPFANAASEEGFLSSALGPVGQVFALEPGVSALPERARIAAVLRADVVAWLQQGAFEVVEPWVSDTQLAHAGFADRMSDPANAASLARTLQVDAVLFGTVMAWNRSYYVVQSTAAVGLAVRLLDSSGAELFASERTETIGTGITGGPTGYVSAATEPLSALRPATLRELMRSTTRDLAIDLNGSPLGAEPGPLAPRLSIVAVQRQHDGPYRAGERIDVIAVGTSDCEVRFDLGALRTGVPMAATGSRPDARGERTTYQGHYIVQVGEAAQELPLFCTIRRQVGSRTQASRYRWEGSVSLAAR